MTAIILLLLLLGLLSYREILFFLVHMISMHSKKTPSEKWSVRLKAEGFLVPDLYLSGSSPVESFVIGYGMRLRILLSESLWNQFDDREKEATLIWASLATRQSPSWVRGLIDFKCQRSDRDTALFLNESKDWVRALQKIESFRYLNPPTAVGALFTGFSFLGSSLLSAWPKVPDRVSELETKISKLQSL